MTPSDLNARRGFSLMEAMVVLVVAGMALMLVFAVGGRAAQTAFRIGDRSLRVADGHVAEDNLRTLMRGMALAPAGVRPETLDRARFEGGAAEFGGDALLDRATLCAPAGPVRGLRITLQSRPDGDVVTCRIGGGPEVLVADLRPRRAAFAYSEDGARWSGHWTGPSGLGPGANPREQRLFLRLLSRDGDVEIIDAASSGRPALNTPRSVPQQQGPDL